jgi:AraC family transcriptional activator of pobA
MQRFKTISEFHQFQHLSLPEHPLLSIVDVAAVTRLPTQQALAWTYDFYCIAIKCFPPPTGLRVRYGQQVYDFTAGLMSFFAPGQVISLRGAATATNGLAEPLQQMGWLLLIHPDFLWNTSLATHIKHYAFWGYAVHEALFLSTREQTVLAGLLQTMQQEYGAAIDQFSKRIIVAHVEALLHYADRFYHRQFLTREKTNHHLVARLDKLLTDYFDRADLPVSGLPTAQYLADALHLSPVYLRSLLKLLTGQTTQQCIHAKLLEKAKEKLTATNLSVSEVAYQLGFEHVQSFSRLFKAKTSLSPIEFKQSFTN